MILTCKIKDTQREGCDSPSAFHIFLYISECHADLNAIISGFRRLADLHSCTMYLTHSPCDHCSRMIAQSGIKKVIWAHPSGNDARDMYQYLKPVEEE